MCPETTASGCIIWNFQFLCQELELDVPMTFSMFGLRVSVCMDWNSIFLCWTVSGYSKKSETWSDVSVPAVSEVPSLTVTSPMLAD